MALITDAGTPGISDPGARLVAAAHEAGCQRGADPGSKRSHRPGQRRRRLPDGRFLFEGFLPSRPKHRRDRLAVLAALPVRLPAVRGAASHRGDRRRPGRGARARNANWCWAAS